MAKKKNNLINLLPQLEFEGSITGRILRWAMTTFRYIVIVTELVVMAAFLSRFWLDAKNSDLNDELKIKTAQILAQKDFEKDFRDLQNRLKIFQEISKDTASETLLNNVVKRMPTSVSLQSISYQPESIQVKGLATSELGIAQFLANLKEDPSFKGIQLGQLGASENNQAISTFTLIINY